MGPRRVSHPGQPPAPRPHDPAPEPESEAVRLARWLEAWPSNRDGEDKTWVLTRMRSLERAFRSARRLPGIGP